MFVVFIVVFIVCVFAFWCALCVIGVFACVSYYACVCLFDCFFLLFGRVLSLQCLFVVYVCLFVS